VGAAQVAAKTTDHVPSEANAPAGGNSASDQPASEAEPTDYAAAVAGISSVAAGAAQAAAAGISGPSVTAAGGTAKGSPVRGTSTVGAAKSGGVEAVPGTAGPSTGATPGVSSVAGPGSATGWTAAEAKEVPGHAVGEVSPSGLSGTAVGTGPGTTAEAVKVSGAGSTGPAASASASHSAVEPEVRTLVATPNVLEVGIDGGTNGWLRVRAEMDGTGGVTASVLATTASAVEALHKELPALSAYLTHESVGVNSLVVNRAAAGATAQDAAMSFGAGSGGEFGSGRGRPSGNEAISSPVGADFGERGAAVGAVDLASATSTGGSYGAGSGGWLNVVA
jgi:hypothetical protein